MTLRIHRRSFLRHTGAVSAAALAGPALAQKDGKAVAERRNGTPFLPVRSVMRQFVSEAYDKPWFYDREFWPAYLSMLVGAKFNRLNLTFGLGYDALKNVTDSYFLFLYPFLIDVPGYGVRVTNLSDAERARNLEALQYIAKETVAHGLDFELGIWMHGYEWIDSPKARYAIEGLTPQTHAGYCRDALTMVLKAVPEVSSVGLRIHGESGVPEGSYGFWKTVFDGAATCGRKVELDLHAKGIDDEMIANALATGLPVNLSPKFSTEHMGLPYQPAEIRPSEIPKPGETGKGLMTLSEGARSFTRYSFADLMREDRKYTVRTRLFAGTQHILASGDPQWAAAYAKAFAFCDMTGADLMEPLTDRGRRGSSSASPRDGYAAKRLETPYDWEKYAAWYRAFGFAMADPENVPPGDAALAAASRILPLVTMVHSASAACDLYWPEIYWNMPMASEAEAFFWDTPSPRSFQNVTALDPQIFSSCAEHAEELLSGTHSGKYSPVESAVWLEALSASALGHLKAARSVDAMRNAIDIEIAAALGRFFAAKLRAGVLMALFEKSGDKRALAQCVARNRIALDHWKTATAKAHGIYADDLSVSDRFTERGAWADRIAPLMADIASLEQKLAAAKDGEAPTAAIAACLGHPKRRPLAVTHTPPANFQAGQALPLAFAAPRNVTTVRLYYRRVTQAERWVSVEMTARAGTWRAEIPGDYTASPYPLQYYFAPRVSAAKAWLCPGIGEDLSGTPYYVVRRG